MATNNNNNAVTTYLPATHVLKLRYAISRATLGRWADGGKIGVVRAHGNGKRLYSATNIDRVFGNKQHKQLQPEKAKKNLYPQSSEKQRPDHEQQIQDLQQAIHPD